MKIILLLTTFALSIGAFGTDMDLLRKKIEGQHPHRGRGEKEKLDFELALVQEETRAKIKIHDDECQKPSELSICRLTRKQILDEGKIRTMVLKRDFEHKKHTEIQKHQGDCYRHYRPSCVALTNVMISFGELSRDDYMGPPPLSRPETPKSQKICRWAQDIPRRLISGPACKGPKKICVGHVICTNQHGFEVVKTATCSPENCKENNASDCATESGFSSESVGEYDGVSKKVLRAIQEASKE